MRESLRQSYLTAMGITSWVPVEPLPHAAQLYLTEPEEAEPEALVAVERPEAMAEQNDASAPVQAQQAETSSAAPRTPAAPLLAALKSGQPLKAPAPEVQSPVGEEPAAIPVEAVAVAPFYLQLWMAGPCALLIEIADPGLEKGTPHFALLCDILRAAGLPVTPRLQADFRWPLSRNPQVARSAEAASEALQAFMQARLEQSDVVSIGCFGALTGLLVEPDPQSAAALCGREARPEQLVAAWFSADLQGLMDSADEKARLWHLLKRVMPRWQDRA